MQRPLATLLPPFAALAAFLLPASARCDVPTGAIPADPLVNVQCEGDTSNTGILALGGRNSEFNGLIVDGFFSDGIITSSDFGYTDAFKSAWSPDGWFVDLDHYLYIAPDTFMEAMRSAGRAEADDFSLPEWTVVTRVMMPEDGDSGSDSDENVVVLALGANHRGVDEGFQALGTLVVTTGTQATNRGDGANGDDRTGDELILWYISDGNYGRRGEVTNTVTQLGSVKVPCLTDSFHLLTVRYENRRVELFLNDRRVVSARLPEGEPEIAPGLQYGQLMGGSDIPSDFSAGRFEQASGVDDGAVDCLLVYDRLLTDAEIHTLSRAYPYIHMDEGLHGGRGEDSYVRYIRRVNVASGGSKLLNWVADAEHAQGAEDAWVRQYSWYDGNTAHGTWWPSLDDEDAVRANLYDEPAEGSIVAIECVGGGTVTFEVNTEKGGLFPSSDRTYAQLEVNGEGTVKIRPCSGWETVTGDSVTLDPTRASGYGYGTLFFTGSANDALGLSTRSTYDATATGVFRTDAEVSASVCDFSNDIVFLRGAPTVTFVADAARVRGLKGPVVKCRLTKEISGDSADRGTLGTNPSVNLDYAQASTLAYVPTYKEGDAWLITDKTNLDNTDDVVFSHPGLVAWYLNQVDPLYVDLADVTPEGVGGAETDHFFSERLPWRRGGYDGAEADPEEFQHAAHLNVLLRRGEANSKQDVRLSLPAAKRVRTLTIDQPPASEGAELGLLRLDAKTTETLLTVSGTIKVNGVLRAYNGTETTVGDSETTVGDTTLDTPGFAEPLDPTDGTADGENVWDGALEDTLIGLYQDGSYIGGEAEGYTQGTGKVLSASDISEAMLCFRNVAALATHGEGVSAARVAAEHSDDYAAVADLIVAYEFGISRVTLERDEDGNEVALVAVTLRNDLATDFADRTEHIVAPEGVTDIEHATPAYAEGTALVFAVNGEIVAADAVTEERGAARADGTSLTRRFRVSLAGMSADEDGRLALTVRAEPPDGTQAASAE